MALCGGASKCGCAFVSDSLTFEGTGDRTNPLHIETYEGVVADDSDVASPFLGQRIYETSTGRMKVYDGTNWVIYGGNWPGAQVERQAVLSLSDNTPTTIALPTEIYDTDGFHFSSDGFLTIPSGLGGDYLVLCHGQFAASATGYRYIRPVLANNTVVSQNNGSRTGGYAMVNTGNNGFPVAELFRLEPGATITLTGFQLSGGALDIALASMKILMVRHDPSFT